jgi:enoyl-CoA hydratase/carnithine racemase
VPGAQAERQGKQSMEAALNAAGEPVVKVEREGDAAWVVLNRPEALNALNKAMWARVAEVMTELDAEESLRCVVLRGAGDKAMGPGADIKEFETERADAADGLGEDGIAASALPETCPYSWEQILNADEASGPNAP